MIGAGWAGLAAAVRACQSGHLVTVFESAPMAGGRARSDDEGAGATDNGQHILLGGYGRTLALMRDVGVDVDAALLRLPLTVRYADGSGFALPATGNRALAALRALGAARGFSAVDKIALAATALKWQWQRFRCAETLTVQALLHATPERVRIRLLEPLCLAALNTPPAQASAAIFLAVMRDSLFGERNASDLLLPQLPLARLLPTPAVDWLRAHGATVALRRRIVSLERAGPGWVIDDAEPFDQVVVATPAGEAARLVAAIAPDWAAVAAALAHEPIFTLVLEAPKRPWPAPMMALDSDDDARPAQFAFKLSPQPLDRDRVVMVVSAAGGWLDQGVPAVTAAVTSQYRSVMSIGADERIDLLSARADRRATFRCSAGVIRPPMRIASQLWAAGDYVAGPYPATLEAAVQSGEAAADAISAGRG